MVAVGEVSCLWGMITSCSFSLYPKGKELVILTVHESRYERNSCTVSIMEGRPYVKRIALDPVEKVIGEFALMK